MRNIFQSKKEEEPVGWRKLLIEDHYFFFPQITLGRPDLEDDTNRKIHTKFQLESLKARVQFQAPDIKWRIILKLILNK